MTRNAHILYLFINLPYFWFCKIGITRKSAKRRAKQVDRAAPGTPIPVFILFAPFLAYPIEQGLHWMMEGLETRFYRGDGSTEWFFILAALPALAVMVSFGCIHFKTILKQNNETKNLAYRRPIDRFNNFCRPLA